MGSDSKIEWTHHTFNPWIGCSKVSDGCRFCYAERQNSLYRWNAQKGSMRTKGENLWGPGAPRKQTSEGNWKLPLKWNKECRLSGQRQRVFCSSLADVFDEEAPEKFRDDLFSLIRETRHLDWLLLTKRPQNIAGMLPPDWQQDGQRGYANVWLGASVENQNAANERVPVLLDVPARIHFLSCEPLLGPVDLDPLGCPVCLGFEVTFGEPGSQPWCIECDVEMGGLGWLDGIDWVICGGESGPHARPFRMDWARALMQQCRSSEISFFMKQLGSNPQALFYSEEDREWADTQGWEWPVPIGWSETDGQPSLDAQVAIPKRDRKGGDVTEFPPDFQIREFP